MGQEEEDALQALLRVLETGEGDERMQQLKWALEEGERRRAKQPDSAEAREWLASNRNPRAMAVNKFQTRAAAVQFVEALYSAGAARVVVDNIAYEDAEGPHSDSLVVELPVAPEARAKVLGLCEASCHEDGEDFTDRGQGSVSLWWD